MEQTLTPPPFKMEKHLFLTLPLSQFCFITIIVDRLEVTALQSVQPVSSHQHQLILYSLVILATQHSSVVAE